MELCINYKGAPDWENRVIDLTGGSGIDLVVEVGGVVTFGNPLWAVRVSGDISLVGILSGRAGEPHCLRLNLFKPI